MKTLKIVTIVVIIVLVGGLVYEKISSYISHRRADALIAGYIADNQRLRDRLVDAESRVTDLKGTVADLRQGDRELGEQLAASTEIAADLSEEDRRLAEALSGSESSARAISVVSRELGNAIDRAWNIIEQYPIPTGSE